MMSPVKSLRALTLSVALGVLVSASGEQASGRKATIAAGLHCPSAYTPYSSKTVLMDLLINPATRSVLDKDLPDLLSGLPELVTRTTPPSFSAIFDVASVANFKKTSLTTAAITILDADLSAIPVTQDAALARCARYDEGPSELPATVRKPSVLVFSKVNGYRDVDALNTGTAALRKNAAARGWTMVFTENGALSPFANPKGPKLQDAAAVQGILVTPVPCSGVRRIPAQRAARVSIVAEYGGTA
jgi:hypothetical protein